MTAYLSIEDAEFGQFDRPNRSLRLAYEWRAGNGPPLMFLPGFASHMHGSKASALADFCAERELAILRFDYRGHGQSDGAFIDGTIGRWLNDALAIFDHVITEPAILIGSSMGGWLMLHVALARPQLVAGLIGLASAPDFADRLSKALDDEQHRQLRRVGKTQLPSLYGDPMTLTADLLNEASTHNLLGGEIHLQCPCHLIHGQCDPDVPWTISLDLAARITSPHVTVELIKDGDHRLSRPGDIRRMFGAIDRLRSWHEQAIQTP